MKAIVCDGFGGPEVLKVGEIDMPKCNENEVIIKVEASACNRADTM
jgi:NADPH2:quinone reductase